MGFDDFPGSPTASQQNSKPELKSSPTTLPCETKAKPDASVRTPRQTNTQKELPGRSSSFFIFTTPSDRKRGPVEIEKVTTYQEHRDTENEDPSEQSEKKHSLFQSRTDRRTSDNNVTCKCCSAWSRNVTLHTSGLLIISGT